MMLFMFPVMFGMFSLFFPLGLVVYWVASTLIGIVMQYFRHRLGRTLPADPIGLERRHSETRAYLERSPAG